LSEKGAHEHLQGVTIRHRNGHKMVINGSKCRFKSLLNISNPSMFYKELSILSISQAARASPFAVGAALGPGERGTVNETDHGDSKENEENLKRKT
jgi:hypothetical protein